MEKKITQRFVELRVLYEVDPEFTADTESGIVSVPSIDPETQKKITLSLESMYITSFEVVLIRSGFQSELTKSHLPPATTGTVPDDSLPLFDKD